MRTNLERQPVVLLVIVASVLVATRFSRRMTQAAENGVPSPKAFVPYFFDDFEIYDGPPLARDRWESYEMYLFIDNQPVDGGGRGRFRIWRDGKLILDRADVPTITEADGTIDHLYMFTYWNNEKPPTNHVFVDDLVIATSNSPPPNTDDAGNRFIGDWTPER